LIFVGAAKRGFSKSGFWQIHSVIGCWLKSCLYFYHNILFSIVLRILSRLDFSEADELAVAAHVVDHVCQPNLAGCPLQPDAAQENPVH
jgi:hypothetical protein